MSPRSKEQFEAIREEKKALIMDAALEHFAREGYHNSTINIIAKHAGISKGLMYNYFKSKEELLAEIINESICEISAYFDLDRDGILTEEEFELFLRKSFVIIREKAVFWRLFFQLMFQKDIREQLLVSFPGTVSDNGSGYPGHYVAFANDAIKLMLKYFKRKKDKKPPDYDPVLDMHMFIYHVKGLAVVTVYADKIDEEYFEKAINRIIELYK